MSDNFQKQIQNWVSVDNRMKNLQMQYMLPIWMALKNILKINGFLSKKIKIAR